VARGLVLLSCSFEKSGGPGRLSELPLGTLGDAAKGDRVYSIGTQKIGDAVFENSVLDGSVSSAARSHGKRKLIGTTIPANAGSLGSPIVDREGRLVGVLVAGVEGRGGRRQERASWALPAEEVAEALEHAKASLGESADHERIGTYERPTTDMGRIAAAGKTFVAPYPDDDSVPLGEGAGIGSPMLSPAQDGILLWWDAANEKLAGLSRGKTAPVWTKPARDAFAVLHKPFAKYAGVVKESESGRSFVLDARTGSRRMPLGRSFVEAKPVAWFEFAPYWLLVKKSGFSFFHARKGREYDLDLMKEFTILGRVGDDVLFATDNGHLGLFNGKSFAAVLGRAQSLLDRWLQIVRMRVSVERKVDAAEMINTQLEVLGDELRREFTVFEAEGFDPEQFENHSDGLHVERTHRVIICHQIWEIGPKKLAYVGQLEPIRHSDAGEEWFYAFLDERSVGEKRNWHVSVSPDARYAMTETHLFSLKTLEPLVELPFPSAPSGFMSDGRTVFLYDRCNERVAFMDLEMLLEIGRRPWSLDDEE
jgi:hypothetical protein